MIWVARLGWLDAVGDTGVPPTQVLPSRMSGWPLYLPLWPLPDFINGSQDVQVPAGTHCETPELFLQPLQMGPGTGGAPMSGLSLPHFPSIATFSALWGPGVKPTLPRRLALSNRPGYSHSGPVYKGLLPEGCRWLSLVSCVYRPRNHL